MKMRFICEPYLQKIYQNKMLAIRCWQDGFDSGMYFFEQMMWRDALPHLGRAYAASEVILATGAMETEDACEIYTASSLALISSLANLKYTDECVEIYTNVISRLEIVTKQQPELSFWLEKFEEQAESHNLRPGLLDRFKGMLIMDRKIMPLHATVH